MKNSLLSLLTLAAISVGLSACQSIPATDPYGLAGKSHEAVTPADRAHVDWWMPRHEQVLERVSQGNVALIMLGDSITHGWERNGKDLWNEFYAPRNAVNMGFGGDRTQHVLWRLQNGEVDGISPTLAVLMIGTNNSNSDPAEQVADGIKAVCAEIRTRLPTTKILVLAIFPRAMGNREQRELVENGATYNDQWARNDKTNKLVSEIADNKMIYFRNINRSFLDEDGTLPREIMPDLLHLSQDGYRIWAEAIEPSIRELMGEDQSP